MGLKYWNIIAGIIAILRITNVQIADCLNQNVAKEVKLSPQSPKDNSCYGVRIRELLFQLIRISGLLSTEYESVNEVDEQVLYVQQLATNILFSFVEVLYHPDELGDLIQSMVTRDIGSPQFKTFLSL